MNKTSRQFPYRFTSPLSVIPPFRIGEIISFFVIVSIDLPINLLKPLERTSSVRRDYLNLLSTPWWAEIGTVFVRFPRTDNVFHRQSQPQLIFSPVTLVSCVCFPWKLENFEHFATDAFWIYPISRYPSVINSKINPYEFIKWNFINSECSAIISFKIFARELNGVTVF